MKPVKNGEVRMANEAEKMAKCELRMTNETGRMAKGEDNRGQLVKPKALMILQSCALAVFVAGVLMSIAAIRQNHELRDKIKNKIETLSQLVTMKQTHDRHQAALHVFEGLSNASPASLASLGRAVITNATPEIREREARKLAAGWTLWQMEVVFSEVNLGQIPVFLQSAALQRPPWRLVECTLASSRQADGMGRAVLIMEVVGKGGKPEDRRQTTEDSLKRTPDAGRRTTEDRGQNSEISGQQPAVLPMPNAERPTPNAEGRKD